MNALKKFAFAVLAMLVVGQSQAAYTLSPSSDVYILDSLSTGGSFTHSFQLSVEPNSGVDSGVDFLNVVAGSKKLVFIDPASFYFTLSNGVSTWVGNQSNGYALSLVNMTAGMYDLTVHGDAIGTSAIKGQYGIGFVATAPIPEPATYAMLLAGIGMVSMIARRRARSE